MGVLWESGKGERANGVVSGLSPAQMPRMRKQTRTRGSIGAAASENANSLALAQTEQPVIP